MALALFVGVIGLLYLLYWVKRREYTKMIDRFPGPKSYPVVGNFLEWNYNPHEMFLLVRKYANEFKMTYRVWVAYIGGVCIITPEDAEIVLSSSTEIKKSLVYTFIQSWLGTGLLTSEGKKWHERRKILTPAFHFTILKRFVEIFNDHSEKLVNELKKECQKPKTNIVPLMSQYSLNIICETAMGQSLNSNGIREKGYFQAVHGMGQIIFNRSMNPSYYNNYLFNCSPLGWKQRKCVKILHDFTEQVIKEKEVNLQVKDNDLDHMNGDINRKSRLVLLDLLIDAKNNKGIIDDAGILEEVDTFMFTGHDTVGLALCFSLMTLANHKDVQEKIFEELCNIFETSNRQPTFNDLQNMKYLEMCLKECLRLYPSVPIVSRELTEDLILTNGVAPRGCVVSVCIYDLHRNPNVFPEPEKFDPDRFLPENVKGRHPFSYIPFSAGLRNCIGQKFAMLELKTTISSILRNYELEAVTKTEDLRFVADVVIRNEGPVYVQFIERENKI